MKKMLAVLSMVLCLFISWNPAGAYDVITFESLSPSGGSMIALYQEGGYSVTNDFDIIYGIPGDPPLPYAFGWWSTSYTAGYTGSMALFNNYQGLTAALTKNDNTPFSMYSIGLSMMTTDLSAGWGAGGAVKFTGIKSNNSAVTQTFTYSNVLGIQTFLFSSDFNDLKSLSWVSPTDQGFQFDNITMYPSTPVPIPAAVWLLGSGLLGLVAIRRRFKK